MSVEQPDPREAYANWEAPDGKETLPPANPATKSETEGHKIFESPTLNRYREALQSSRQSHERDLFKPGQELPPKDLEEGLKRQEQLKMLDIEEANNRYVLAMSPLVDLEDRRASFTESMTKSPKGIYMTDLAEKFEARAGQRMAEVIASKRSPERILSELQYDSQVLTRKIERLKEKLRNLDPESTEAFGMNIELSRSKETLLKTEARLKEEERRQK